MVKNTVSKEKAIKDIKEMFNISIDESSNDCYEKDGSFVVSKKRFERFEVVGKLQDYFSDKCFVEGFGLEISPITLIYTTFKIININ